MVIIGLHGVKWYDKWPRIFQESFSSLNIVLPNHRPLALHTFWQRFYLFRLMTWFSPTAHSNMALGLWKPPIAQWHIWDVGCILHFLFILSVLVSVIRAEFIWDQKHNRGTARALTVRVKRQTKPYAIGKMCQNIQLHNCHVFLVWLIKTDTTRAIKRWHPAPLANARCMWYCVFGATLSWPKTLQTDTQRNRETCRVVWNVAKCCKLQEVHLVRVLMDLLL